MLADKESTGKGGAWIRFNASTDTEVLARVGVSFISEDQACSNAESEIPSFDFNSTHSAAVSIWKEKLSPIRVSRNSVNESLLTNFYSGIYRTLVQPQNYTGENPLWESSEPYFDSLYWYGCNALCKNTLISISMADKQLAFGISSAHKCRL